MGNSKLRGDETVTGTSGNPCPSGGTAYLMILNAVEQQDGLYHGKRYKYTRRGKLSRQAGVLSIGLALLLGGATALLTYGFGLRAQRVVTTAFVVAVSPIAPSNGRVYGEDISDRIQEGPLRTAHSDLCRVRSGTSSINAAFQKPEVSERSEHSNDDYAKRPPFEFKPLPFNAPILLLQCVVALIVGFYSFNRGFDREKLGLELVGVACFGYASWCIASLAAH